MAHIERRRRIRKPVRLQCIVQFSSGVSIYGHTRDLSLSGVNIESAPVSGTGKRNPQPGETGLLTLKFKRDDVVDSLLVQCRVVHVTANGIGLAVRLSELGKKDQQIVGQIIATGKAEI